MRLVVPCLNDFNLDAESHSTIVTDSSKVICLEKTERGSWINNAWNGKGVYDYTIVLCGNIVRRISEETYNILKKLLELE